MSFWDRVTARFTKPAEPDYKSLYIAHLEAEIAYWRSRAEQAQDALLVFQGKPSANPPDEKQLEEYQGKSVSLFVDEDTGTLE